MDLVALQHVESSQNRDQTTHPLYWQADSYPLYHQESSEIFFNQTLVLLPGNGLKVYSLQLLALLSDRHPHFPLLALTSSGKAVRECVL